MVFSYLHVSLPPSFLYKWSNNRSTWRLYEALQSSGLRSHFMQHLIASSFLISTFCVIIKYICIYGITSYHDSLHIMLTDNWFFFIELWIRPLPCIWESTQDGSNINWAGYSAVQNIFTTQTWKGRLMMLFLALYLCYQSIFLSIGYYVLGTMIFFFFFFLFVVR